MYSRKSWNGGWFRGQSPVVHFAMVETNTTARFRVTSDTEENIEVARISPRRWERDLRQVGSVVEFSMYAGESIHVGFGEHTFHTLYVASNPITSVASGAPNVLTFGAGLHEIGPGFDIQHGLSTPTIDTVYLAPGALVIGSLNVTKVPSDTKEVKILGSGILSGAFASWEDVKKLTWADQRKFQLVHTDVGPNVAHGLLVDGPTFLASPKFNFVLSMKRPKEFRHLRILSPWTYNTDFGNIGTSEGPDFAAHRCFFLNGDDCAKVEQGVGRFTACVFGGRNAALVGFGPGYYAEQERLSVVSDCDVILQDIGLQGSPIRARVDSPPGKTTGGQCYESIRVDGPVDRLFDLQIKDTGWGYDAPGELYGKVEGVSFENIVLTGGQRYRSIVRGVSPSQTMGTPNRPLLFRNVRIDGVLVTNENASDHFDVGPFAHVDFRR